LFVVQDEKLKLQNQLDRALAELELQFTSHQDAQRRVRAEMQDMSATFERLQDEKQTALVRLLM
jgi:hypothetical protein